LPRELRDAQFHVPVAKAPPDRHFARAQEELWRGHEWAFANPGPLHQNFSHLKFGSSRVTVERACFEAPQIPVEQAYRVGMGWQRARSAEWALPTPAIRSSASDSRATEAKACGRRQSQGSYLASDPQAAAVGPSPGGTCHGLPRPRPRRRSSPEARA